MSLESRKLDTAVAIVTPENIAFQYRVAGPFLRLPAYLIDFLLRGLVCVIALIVAITTAVAGIGGLSMAMWLILWFVLEWFYGGLCETFFNGQTVGKRLVGLRVVSVDGQPINAWQAILRNVLRLADGLPMFMIGSDIYFPFFMLGLAAVSMNDRYQRLGDLAAGTMVVVEEKRRLQGLMTISDPQVMAMAGRIPANFPFTRKLGLALAAYVQRRKFLVPARRLEIARHLATPIRDHLSLPANTDPDLLWCGLFQRAFHENAGGKKSQRLAVEPV